MKQPDQTGSRYIGVTHARVRRQRGLLKTRGIANPERRSK